MNKLLLLTIIGVFCLAGCRESAANAQPIPSETPASGTKVFAQVVIPAGGVGPAVVYPVILKCSGAINYESIPPK